jgi:hypothetical protein
MNFDALMQHAANLSTIAEYDALLLVIAEENRKRYAAAAARIEAARIRRENSENDQRMSRLRIQGLIVAVLS